MRACLALLIIATAGAHADPIARPTDSRCWSMNDILQE